MLLPLSLSGNVYECAPSMHINEKSRLPKRFVAVHSHMAYKLALLYIASKFTSCPLWHTFTNDPSHVSGSCPTQSLTINACLLQNYFAQKFICALDPIAAARQQTLRQVLLVALTNLQGLYQHNQLIFQVCAQVRLTNRLPAPLPLKQTDLQQALSVLAEQCCRWHMSPL